MICSISQFGAWALTIGLAGASFASETPLPASPSSGAAIYEEKCTRCHGDQGQGVSRKYEEPLHGDRSLSSLARLIERTMPENKPETCVGDDALRVAEYIYHEFYSLEARQKKGLAPVPRVELVRMTVPQYRNAVADLLGRFTPASAGDDGKESSDGAALPGLQGRYFQSKGMSKADSLELEQVDQWLEFDFGEGRPSERITADQFTIIWQGSLLAKDTGHYEFRVRTQNGARVYLNNDTSERNRKLRDDSSVAGQSALIDAWVGSGEMRERTARVFLLGGRQYPLRLEFFKYKEETASVKLEWKPPHGTWSVLDHNHLTTASTSRTFVLDTPFPADDRSLGYERGSSVSPGWQAAAMKAATATAAEVVDRLPLLAGFKKGDPKRTAVLQKFVPQFARAAFRRPLTSQEDDLYRNILFQQDANPESAVRRAIVLVLMSPSFHYIDLTPSGRAPSPHAVASRLSFALWDSIPDQELIDAAEKGQLATTAQIESHARRMISDPRAKAKMREFFHHWLELEERDLAKDKDAFPEFDEAVIADLRRSLELFIEQVVWNEQSDYRQLLLADYLILNDRLRSLYAPSSRDRDEPADSTACDEPSTAEFEPVSMADKRAGVLTHPYLLSAFAYPNNTSPIHRGVFLTRNIIGRGLKPPPVAVAFKEEEFDPDSTMREKITQLTRDTACMSCHSVINPLGFALENYDAVGRWRMTDNDKPVDTKGQYVTDEGTTVDLESALDVARFAVGSETAHQAFVHQVFHHLVKQNAFAYGPDTLNRLRLQFQEDNFNIQQLMVRIATLAAGHGQK